MDKWISGEVNNRLRSKFSFCVKSVIFTQTLSSLCSEKIKQELGAAASPASSNWAGFAAAERLVDFKGSVCRV